MAPETITGQGSSFATDQYQLGLVLYRLCIGAPAVSEADGPCIPALTSGVAQKRAGSFGTVGAFIIAKMLSVEPTQRFDTILDLWNTIHFLRDSFTSTPIAPLEL